MLNVYDILWGVDGVYWYDLVDWEKMMQEKFEEFFDYFKEVLMFVVVNEVCEIVNGNDVVVV